jgi:hypothetical protein
MFNQIYEMNPELLEADNPRDAKGVDRTEDVPYVMWKQRNGILIRLIDMDDKHLFNTIRMLERIADRRAARAELAQNRCEADEYFDYSPAQFLRPVYHSMVAMAAARGIQL